MPKSLIGNAISILNESKNINNQPVTPSGSVSLAWAESAFTNAVSAMNDKNSAITEAKLTLYKSLAEATNTSTMLEAFSDYHVQASEIIKEFSRFMEEGLDNFISSMEDFIDADKVIEDHKSALTKDIKFYEDGGSHRGYNFIILKDIPNLSALQQFDANLFYNILGPGVNDLSVQSMKQSIEAIDLEPKYRQFRGAVLGRPNDEVSENEYPTLLFRVFRNNNLDEESIKITTQTVKNIVELWFGFNDIKKELKSSLKSINDAFDSIIDNIIKVTNNNNGMTVQAFTNLLPGDINVEYIDGKEFDNYAKNMPGELMLQFDTFCKVKLDELQKYSDIICLAFTAKLDAIKAMYGQNRIILHDVCRAIDNPEYQQYEYGMKPKEGPVVDNDGDAIESVLKTKSDGVEP